MRAIVAQAQGMESMPLSASVNARVAAGGPLTASVFGRGPASTPGPASTNGATSPYPPPRGPTSPYGAGLNSSGTRAAPGYAPIPSGQIPALESIRVRASDMAAAAQPAPLPRV